MRYLSLCSGIEAASVAWHPLGWRAVAFSEIDPFPCAVLAHHYPDVPNLGDMTRFEEWPDASAWKPSVAPMVPVNDVLDSLRSAGLSAGRRVGVGG